jgi:hypothetical protein
MSSTAPPAGLRKRATGSSAGGGGGAPAGSQGGSAGSFSVRLYNEASPGFKVGPYFIVMASVVYLVCVVVLHIWGRIGGKS